MTKHAGIAVQEHTRQLMYKHVKTSYITVYVSYRTIWHLYGKRVLHDHSREKIPMMQQS